MTETTPFLPGLSPVGGKEIVARFDGGRLSSDGGVLLLREIEARLGIADLLAACLPDQRDPDRLSHTLADMIRARIFAIACGYEDCDDLDSLRFDPAFKLACGRLPETGEDLMSQPTLSRLENLASWRDLGRMGLAMIDLFCASFSKVPEAITLDIDDTDDAVHGAQQLALFNAHYDEHCFQPIHVFDAASGKDKLRRFFQTPYRADSWTKERRVVARVEATAKGADARFIVTNLEGRARPLYEKLYCARGQAENLIKDMKRYTKSDRTSCHRWQANQFRLFLHMAAYWLLHRMRRLAPRKSRWRGATFQTIRDAFLKVAARVTELKSRITIALPTAYPNHKMLVLLAGEAAAQGP